jgi:hypothetical protein
MTGDMVREWVRRNPEEFTTTSATVQSPREMLDDLERKIAQLQTVAATLYRRWLREIK